MNLSSKRLRVLLIPVQIAVSILIFYLLFQTVDLSKTYEVLSQVKVQFLLLSLLFMVSVSLSIGLALHSALKSAGAAPSIKTTQLANFGGQLLSDITPAKTGYFATPVLLNQLKGVPIEKGLMSVMSVGAINFFIKAAFSTTALIYFLSRISIDATMMNAMLISIGILIVCGVGLTILVWTNYFSGFLQKLSKIPLLGAVIKRLNSIRATFAQEKSALRKSAKTTVLFLIISMLLATFALVMIAQALGLTQPTFVDLLFLGPITAVFTYVPVTFAGLGLQEAAYVFLLTSIGAPFEVALPFALLVRIMGLGLDLIGLPPVLKTGTGLLGRIGQTNPEPPTPEKQIPKQTQKPA